MSKQEERENIKYSSSDFMADKYSNKNEELLKPYSAEILDGVEITPEYFKYKTVGVFVYWNADYVAYFDNRLHSNYPLIAEHPSKTGWKLKPIAFYLIGNPSLCNFEGLTESNNRNRYDVLPESDKTKLKLFCANLESPHLHKNDVFDFYYVQNQKLFEQAVSRYIDMSLILVFLLVLFCALLFGW